MHFAQLVLGFGPFLGHGAPTVMDSIVGKLGPLPEYWRSLYNAGEGEDWWYDQSQTPVHSQSLPEFIGRLRPGMGKAERDLIHTVLTRGFYYLPESRLSAA